MYNIIQTPIPVFPPNTSQARTFDALEHICFEHAFVRHGAFRRHRLRFSQIPLQRWGEYHQILFTEPANMEEDQGNLSNLD